MDIGLELVSRSEGGWTVIDVKGEVDLHTAPQLRERLLSHIEQGHRRIVLNLEPLAFIDSTGLGVLVSGLKRLRTHDGELALAAPHDPVKKVLTITGLDKVFTVQESVSELLHATD